MKTECLLLSFSASRRGAGQRPCAGRRGVGAHARQLNVGVGGPSNSTKDTAAGRVGKTDRLRSVLLLRRRVWLSLRCEDARSSILFTASVHVRQLLESGPPVVEVIVVLVPGTG